MQRFAAFALRGAYRAIAEAQAIGATGYLEAAKNHYRAALARFARNDPGAASEAMAAAALARASAAEHPPAAPRDIPTPPAVSFAGGDGPMRPPGPAVRGGPPGGPGGMAGRRPTYGGFPMRGRFDANALANDMNIANTAEAKQLAQKAVEADVARTRAEFAGNAEEAMREGRLAGDLAMAVRALARADHPDAFPRRGRSPGPGRPQRGTAIVGDDVGDD